MTSETKFDRNYTAYWREATAKPIDGLKIPDLRDAKFFFDYLQMPAFETSLDLGSSEGRMFPVLADYSKKVFSIDPDPYAVSVCASKGYEDALVGTAEDTGLPDSSVDFIFSWGVFDVVDLNNALVELNRVCRSYVLFTGKNDTPFLDDKAALVAERNAFLNGHPNKFTNLELVYQYIRSFGFELVENLIFERRGDFGERRFKSVRSDLIGETQGYEYLMLLRRVSPVHKDVLPTGPLWTLHSKTMSQIASDNGFEDCISFFSSNVATDLFS